MSSHSSAQSNLSSILKIPTTLPIDESKCVQLNETNIGYTHVSNNYFLSYQTKGHCSVQCTYIILYDYMANIVTMTFRPREKKN